MLREPISVDWAWIGPTTLVAMATSLREQKKLTSGRLSTTIVLTENLVKIGQVDVEIIRLTEIVKIYE